MKLTKLGYKLGNFEKWTNWVALYEHYFQMASIGEVISCQKVQSGNLLWQKPFVLIGNW